VRSGPGGVVHVGRFGYTCRHAASTAGRDGARRFQRCRVALFGETGEQFFVGGIEARLPQRANEAGQGAAIMAGPSCGVWSVRL
jgi:hypothetical protein